MISRLIKPFYRSELQQASGSAGRRRSPGAMLGLAVMLMSVLAFAAQAQITITPTSLGPLTSLPGGIAGDAYPVITFVATGGSGNYAWSATGLPPGLSLNSAGVLDGTPTSAGMFTATVTVTDGSTPVPLSASKDFPISISGNLTLSIVPPGAIPNAQLNTAFAFQLNAQGGTPPYTWSKLSGSLPPGLTFSSAGLVSGSATATGVFSFKVQVRDAVAATAALSLSLTAVTQSGSAQTRVGVLSQIAAGGGWTTSLYLINNTSSPVTLTVNFYNDDGTPMIVPEQTTLANGATTTSPGMVSLPAQLDPNSTILIQTTTPAGNGLTGWADVLASGPLEGYGVFDYVSASGGHSEGTVPLETSFEPVFEMPYDNTNGVGTAVALTNLSSTAMTTVTAAIWDARGIQLAVETVDVPANGHHAFALTDLAPGVTANRGLVRFRSNAETNLTGLGLRVSPSNAITSLPHISIEE
ncbi:MAG: Ig domain-containing protein [Bryobacteraceae bacterium]|nr:Ig domain-containing protein [Bryobacteraceae bacterium]